jgi:hypothetical protein
LKWAVLLKVNNVYGVPYLNIGASQSGALTTQANIIELYNRRRDASGGGPGTVGGGGIKIGEARVYWYGVSDAPYTDDSTTWDLYLFDVQTYTTLYLAKDYTTSEVPLSFIRGLSSGGVLDILLLNQILVHSVYRRLLEHFRLVSKSLSTKIQNLKLVFKH